LIAATNRVTLYRTLVGDSLLEAGPTGPVPIRSAGAADTQR
jgi:multidrug efflux system outer membrane protein